MTRPFVLLFAGIILLFCTDRAEATNNQAFQQWGSQTLAQVKTDFKLSGSLYAQSLTERWPSYAWGQGVMLSTLTAASATNSSYLAETRAMADELHSAFWCTQNGTSGYNASSGSCGDRYYDDNAWIALALIELYEITLENKYLDRARATVTFCMSGENGPSDSPPGGIRWHESNTGGSSVCAGAPTCLANLKLYQITGVESYKTDGLRLYLWLSTSGLHQYSSGIYHEVNQGALGYLTGVMLQAAIELYRITGSSSYLTEAQRLAAAMEHEFVNSTIHALQQTGKWGGHDMTNAYIELYEVDRNRHWLNIAAGYLDFLHANGKDLATGRYPESWNTVAGAPSAGMLDNASVARAYWKMAQTLGGTAPVYVRIQNRSSSRYLQPYNSGTVDNTQLVIYDMQPASTSQLFTLVDLGNGYYNIRSQPANKALQPYNNASSNNTSVILYTAGAALQGQHWSLTDVGGGYFNIQNRLTGTSMQPFNSSIGNNTSAVIYTTNSGLLSQHWRFVGFNVPTSITPSLSVNGGSWQQMDSASLNAGDDISLRGQASGTGTWAWTGPANFTAIGNEVTIQGIEPKEAGRYYVTYTNSSGVESYACFNIAVPAAIKLYQHCDLTGWIARFGVGAYYQADIIAAGGLNNDASSVRVQPGYRVTFYDLDSFQGSALVKTAADSCFVDDGWNDRVSSMIIEQLATPVAHWRFNENGGSAAADSSAYGFNGVLTNMNQANWVNGKQCGGLSFDGANDYVTVPGFTGITGGQSRTCSAWVRTTKTAAEIINWGNYATAAKWVVRVNETGALRAEVYGGNVYGTTLINDGQWHHIAVVLENDGTPNISEVRLYVDGLPDAPASFTSCAIDTSDWQRLSLGVHTVDKVRYFQGDLDEVQIYGRALTDSEIRDLYELHALTSDIEQDADVDLADFAVLSDGWQSSSGGVADWTCDGSVDMEDLFILIDEWLRSI